MRAAIRANLRGSRRTPRRSARHRVGVSPRPITIRTRQPKGRAAEVAARRRTHHGRAAASRHRHWSLSNSHHPSSGGICPAATRSTAKHLRWIEAQQDRVTEHAPFPQTRSVNETQMVTYLVSSTYSAMIRAMRASAVSPIRARMTPKDRQICGFRG